MKVNQLIAAIHEKANIRDLAADTVDKLIAGNPDNEVTGVATTFMATVDVIKEAIEGGINTIITHEPTFYTHLDETDWLSNNEVYEAKLKLIEDNHISIYRFHDQSHEVKPDLIYEGMNKELGWQNFVDKDNYLVFNFPDYTLGELVEEIKTRLNMPYLRFVGNKNMVCKRAGFLLGGLSLDMFGGEKSVVEWMENEQVDVLLCGEMIEWTSCAFVRDGAMLGFNRGMIVIGHNRSEEAGMKHLVDWVKPLCEDIPVTFIEAKEPFIYG